MRKGWPRFLYLAGIIALLTGILDPLEGSVVIAFGSLLISISTFMTGDRHRQVFLASFIMIAFGVFFLFYFSSLGGFGASSKLPWWWSALLIPYPVGWLLAVVLIIIRIVQKNK